MKEQADTLFVKVELENDKVRRVRAKVEQRQLKKQDLLDKHEKLKVTNFGDSLENTDFYENITQSWEDEA